jgi:anti-sigma regulatory factor (Ser/Thr protein kinase)
VAVDEVENGPVPLTVRGTWDAALRQETTRRLHECFAEGPAAVIVDLTEPLDRMGADRLLPTFTSLPEARTTAPSRHVSTDRMLMRSPPRPGALRAGRRLVTQACAAWSMPELAGDAALVVSELVANAVEHAGTDLVVLVSRRPDGVHIAVRDEDDRMPQMPVHDQETHPRGRGLQLIESVARSWGVMPTAGGKVVWATLRRP